MKDAIVAMLETQESARTEREERNPGYVRGPPKKYEKLIQKLESDVRGHIRINYSFLLILSATLARTRNENPYGLLRKQN